MSFYTSSHGVYLWIKYLKNITHYDDEDGWIGESEEIGKYTYKNILKYMHKRFGDSFGDGEILFNEFFKKDPFFSKRLELWNIKSVDQLDYYAREKLLWRK